MRFTIARFVHVTLFTFFLLICSYILVPRSYRPPAAEKYVGAALKSLPELPELPQLPDWLPSWNPYDDTASEARAAGVREAFVHAWQGYRENAFPHDMLRPLTNKYEDDRSGWGCTAVDSLAAAILLETPEIVETALHHIADINWDKVSSPKVAIFGSTIRYLGAMLSAYDLLTTTHTHLTTNLAPDAVKVLLTQSQALANALSVSFSTPSGINHNQLTFPAHRITPGNLNDITAISGLPLEWAHLSDLTNNQTYGRLAVRSMAPLISTNPESPSPFPGLLPKHINTNTGRIETSDVGGWSHAGGGLYEMLMKLSIYDPVRFVGYREHWKLAADSTMKYLASHPRERSDLTFLADFNDTKLIYRADHSGMFAASSFILGGSVTGETKYLEFGLELVKSYVEMYRVTATGIGPESWGWVPESCAAEIEKREETDRLVEDEFENKDGKKEDRVDEASETADEEVGQKIELEAHEEFNEKVDEQADEEVAEKAEEGADDRIEANKSVKLDDEAGKKDGEHEVGKSKTNEDEKEEEGLLPDNRIDGVLQPSELATETEEEKEECIVPDEYAVKTSDDFAKRNGYFMTNTGYRLRPEVLESLYYAYRVTGDEMYRDWSWEIFLRINETCRAGSAFAELKDVNVVPTVGSKKGRGDRMFSFVLSEVFMYAYIIHVEDGPWHVQRDGSNSWVFSTEGHPMRVASELTPPIL